MAQIELLEASCVAWPAGLQGFDYVVSVLCVHHFPPETKRQIYRNFLLSLKPSGAYVEGDRSWARADGEEAALLDLYHAWIGKLPGGSKGEWNFDSRRSSPSASNAS